MHDKNENSYKIDTNSTRNSFNSNYIIDEEKKYIPIDQLL